MFQKNVQIYPARGRAGQPASGNPIIAAAGGQDSFRAGKDGVVMARFCWRDATTPELANNTGTGRPLGFVQNNGTATIERVGDTASMTIRAGTAVTPVVQGDFFAESTTPVMAGQKVFAVLADGTIKTDAEGATVADAVETDWYAVESADAGQVFTMSTWSRA
ncbi:structural cement protein Gp24 [Trabulsiella odontotermitis]|uniref:Uncharacterized protein n=1 Tax=Trabulsiella odontotermitis TaxID=379893 RepID=A0A0L0GZ93_9ENTR|nr:hypothetical protein [Trabulsiella odontotermitis]KNC94021.1 hypothetical protein GM31_16820 [Trabulsiella odontotermitis]